MSAVKIYRLLIRFDGVPGIPPKETPDVWITERAYTAADAITQTCTKQRFAWPNMLVLEVVPFESA